VIDKQGCPLGTSSTEGKMSIRNSIQSSFARLRSRLLWGACCGGLLSLIAPGCTALHPIRGVPAAYLPDYLEGPTRDNKRTIDLSLLVRTPPDQYRVAAGDVLSVYVPRVLGGQSTEVNTVGLEPPINNPSAPEDPPTIGYPIQVRDDNTIALPQIAPLQVGGLTLHEVEQTIRKAYSVDSRILRPDEAMVLVSLQRARIYRVLVVRQEATTTLDAASSPGSLNIGTSGKGTARTVTLKAYENDVLHALSQGDGVDGLPGLNAENVIYIIRRRPREMAPAYCPPSHINPTPVLTPGDTYGPPIMSPGPANGYDVSQQTPFGAIQQVSYEQTQSDSQALSQPASGMTAQPFGNYRGAPPAGSSGNRQQLAADYGHSTKAYTQPAQYTSGQNFNTQGFQPHAQQQFAGHQGITQAQYTPVDPQPTPYHQPSPYQQGAPYQYPQAAPFNQPLPQGLPPAPTDVSGHSFSQSPHVIPAPATSYGSPGGDMSWGAMLENFDPTINNPNIIRIPVRLGPGEQPNITEEQITLHDGDIVFIDSRETEVFYTAGLLGGGQYTLPRDYDLGVLEAVSIAEGRTGGMGSGLNRSIGGVSALNHDVSNSASRLAILRTLPNGKRITIEVDLRKAMRYQEENIRIQPGDILFLQYTFPEAVCAFTQRYLFEGAIFSLAAAQLQTNR